MQTVVETPSYLTDAERLFSLEERKAIVDRLASDPTCGVVLAGLSFPAVEVFVRSDSASVRAAKVAALESSICSLERTCLFLFWRSLPRTRRLIFRLLNGML